VEGFAPVPCVTAGHLSRGPDRGHRVCGLLTDPSAIDVRLGTVVTLYLALVAVQFVIFDQVGEPL